MSWLGGSLSSFTDQLSNFTKDILTESTEEVSDHATELRLANAKIAELEIVIAANKSETDRLKRATSDISEKAEAAELQIFRMSHEYRTLLQQKETEIKELKDKHHELIEHHSKSDLHPTTSPLKQTPLLTDSGLDNCESDEIGDNISMQREINRLSHETQHLRMQCDHWRRIAQSSKNDERPGSPQRPVDSPDVTTLKSQLKEVKRQTGRDKENHQQEIAALQDLHLQKISGLKQQCKLDVEELSEELESLRQTLHYTEEKARGAASDNKQVEALELLGDIKQLRTDLNDDTHLRQDRLVTEKMDLANELRQALEQKRNLSESLDKMETKQRELSEETNQMVAALGSEENQALTAEIVASLERENLVLKNKVLEVREQLVLVERTVDTLTRERHTSRDSSSQNQWSVHALQDLLTDLRKELEEKDRIIQELENTDQSHGNTLHSVDHEIDEAESFKKSSLDSEMQINELTYQRDELETSLEQLDSQHEEAMTEMIEMRDNLNRQIQGLKTQVQVKDAEIEQLRSAVQATDEVDEVKSLKAEVSRLNDELRKTVGTCVARERNEVELMEKLRKNTMSSNEIIGCRDEEIKCLVEKVKAMVEGRSEGDGQEVDRVVNRGQGSKETLGGGEQVDATVTNLKMLTQESESKSAIMKELEGKLHRLDNELSESQRLNNNFENDLTKLRTSAATTKSNFEESLASLKNESEVTIVYSKQVENQLVTVGAERDTALNDKEQAVGKVEELNQRIQSLDSELIAAKQKMERESHQRSTIISDQNSLLSKIQNLEALLCDKDKALEESVGYENDLLRQVEEWKEKAKYSEGELGQSDSRIVSQIEHYERCLQELKVSRESEGIKQEKERRESGDRVKEKVERIVELERVVRELHIEMDFSKEKIVLSENELCKKISLLEEKASMVEKLENHCGVVESKLEARGDEILMLQKQNGEQIHEYNLLKEKIKDFENLADHEVDGDASNIVLDLTKQLDVANAAIENLEKDNLHIQMSLDEQQNYICELEKMNVKMVEENRINVRSEQKMSENKDNYGLENDIETNEKIGKKMEELQKIIGGKDQVICDLQKTNNSLLKLLETKSTSSSSDKLLLDINKQKMEMQSLKSEREQMMAVLNEKSRECSSLKAEVHRLMGTVMAEKTAINKLQRDNVDLQNHTQSSLSVGQDDMQKEALHRLSNLIKDKDFEIESLALKNGSLLEILHGSSESGNQINKMISERDHLMRQSSELTGQRDQMIHVLNQKHQESVAYHGEIQRLNAFIAEEAEQFQRLEHDYLTLKPQYEDCKLAMVSANDEVVKYKRKYLDLEIKFGEMAQRDDIKNTVDIALYDEKVNEVGRLKDSMFALEKTLNEKISSMNSLQHSLANLESKLNGAELEKKSYKKQVENLAIQIHMLQQEMNDVKQEFEQTEERCKKQTEEINILKEMNSQLSLSLRDKQFETSSMVDKLTMLQAVMGENESEGGQLDVVLKENESLQQQTQVLQRERDQLTLALKQRQNDCTDIAEQLQKLKTKEQKQMTELGRLREHLIRIEESYTQEALKAEGREKELRTRLLAAEDRLASSTQTIQSTSQQANQLVENLQAQLSTMATQRDNAYLQVASLQEQFQEYKLQLCNLQMVLEEFQKEKESMLASETERYEVIIARQQVSLNSLTSDLNQSQGQLSEALEALDASARLTAQLDKKEDTIKALRDEVHLREKVLGEAEQMIKKQKTNSEAKVDKVLMKNLMLGYFSTPTARRPEVIHTIGGVLGFTHEEFAKATDDGDKSWVPGFLRFRVNPTPPSTPSRSRALFGTPHLKQHLEEAPLNKSFSELFVKFLEKESSPPLAVRLPAEEMAEETQRQKPAYNPFTAPRHATLPLSPGGRNSPHESHPLMASAVVNSNLPLFMNLTQPGGDANMAAMTQQSHTALQQRRPDQLQRPNATALQTSVATPQLSLRPQVADIPTPFVNSFVNPLPRSNPSPLTINPSSSAILKNALSGR